MWHAVRRPGVRVASSAPPAPRAPIGGSVGPGEGLAAGKRRSGGLEEVGQPGPHAPARSPPQTTPRMCSAYGTMCSGGARSSPGGDGPHPDRPTDRQRAPLGGLTRKEKQT